MNAAKVGSLIAINIACFGLGYTLSQYQHHGGWIWPKRSVIISMALSVTALTIVLASLTVL